MSAYSLQPLVRLVRHLSSVWPFLRAVILALVILLVLGVGLVYAYRQEHQDRIYPGITVLGLPVGRFTRAEAEVALRAYVHNVRQQPLTIRGPDETVQITLEALGLHAADEEIARLVDTAWWVGRDLPLGSWLTGQFGLITRGYAVPGSLTLDSEQARQALQQLAEQLNREPVSTTLLITNLDSGFVSRIDRSQPGQRLNVEEALSRLQRSLAGHLPTTLDLVLEEIPARITAADLEQPRASVDRLLKSPLVLQAGDKTWSLEPNTLFSMLDTAALAAQQDVPVARLLEDKVRAFVASVAAEANVPAGNPFLQLSDDAITLQPGQPGETLDEPATTRLIMERAFTEQHLLALPLVTVRLVLSEAALDLVRQQVIQRLAQPLVLRYTSQQWMLEGQTLLDLVSLVPAESAAALVAPATSPATTTTGRQPVSQVATPASGPPAPVRLTNFEVALNRARVETFIGEEVVSQVALTVELIRFELRDGHIEVVGGSSGVLPDSLATYDALAAAFRHQSREARIAAVQVRAARPEESAALLEPLRQQAEQFAARPVEVRYGAYTWPITPAELVKMLRFRQSVAGPEPYLDPYRLDTHVTAIAVEARQLALGPRTADGRRRPVDVPRTAESIRQAVQSSSRVVSVEFVAEEDLPPPGPRPGQSAPWIPAS